jgi:hypothetical protein
VRGLLVLAVALALVGCGPPPPPFEDVTAGSGLPGPGPSYDAALADFDGDGLADVFLPNHGWTPALLRNTGGLHFEDVTAARGIGPLSDPHGAGWGDLDGDRRPDLYVGLGADQGRATKANALYRNAGDRFVDVPDAAGAADPHGRARGVSWVDYDRDGRLDLFVANYDTPNALFRNRGDGTFESRAEAAGLARPPASRVVWTDYDGDGWPDVLFVGPRAGIRLFRNRGDGTFADVTRRAGLVGLPPVGGAALGDVDGDGRLDLVLAAGQAYPTSAVLRDGTLVFATVPGGHGFGVTFESPTRPPIALFVGPRSIAADAPGVTVRAEGGGRWTLAWNGKGPLSGTIGPGVTAGALHGLSPWKPVQRDRLFRNRGDGTFAETRALRDLAPRGNAQAAVLADVDDDGDLDLYVVRSGVEAADEPDVLFLNDGHAHFTATAPIPATDGRGCGADFADLDGDGRLDLLLTVGWGRSLVPGHHRLLRNVAPPAHWLALDLVGTRSNRFGLGSWIEVVADGRRQVRFHTSGGYYSQSLLPEHFGLGAATTAAVTVRWPSGVVDRLQADADRRVRVVEGGGAAPG